MLNNLSIQDRATRTETYGTSVLIVPWLSSGGIISPWWSATRDRQLRDFWKRSDHLSGAVYTMTAKMQAIPNKVVAKDASVKAYVEDAARTTDVMSGAVEFGGGWVEFYGKFIEDLLCLAGTTRVHLGGIRRGQTKKIRNIVEDRDPGPVLSVDKNGRIVEREINDWLKTPLGDRRWWWISLKDASYHGGKNKGGIFMTEDHPVLTATGWRMARDVSVGEYVATGDPVPSQEQAQLITGSLLGDGCIGKIRKRSILRFSHCKKQEEWLDLKIDVLSGFQWTGRNEHESSTDGYTSKFIGINTRASLGLNDWRSRWYPNGKKVVSREDVEKYFSPRMMAVWYLDDGSLNKNRTRAGNLTTPHASLYTNGFTKLDTEWLVGFLCGKGFKCNVQEVNCGNGKKYYMIHMSTDGLRNLANFIGAYIPTSMRYKLPENSPEYDESLWELEPAHVYYDEVVASEPKDYTSGYRLVNTTYHIGVDETRNFVAANMVVHNTQDNGCFAEVIGYGDPSGPIIGRPVSIAHLDSSRCTRTGSSIYPVVYHDTDGKRYKLHYSRVIYTSQMTSPNADMFGVGFCASSRAINVTQTLIDILQYKQEKLGSRPHREIIITRGGLDPNDLREAFMIAESEMDSQGLSRYSKIVIGGSSTMPEAGVETVELSSLPDGFDEQTSISMGMATIALAFGVDARELFPSMSAGATRADALLQHLKQRGKGPGQILQVTEQLFNYKFLPPHLKFMFDFQDDAQDRQVAEIRKIRADRRVQDLASDAMSKRVMRETMFTDGDIDNSQFERMELEEGRLPDGSPAVGLFYKKNSEVSRYLDLGVADPLDIDENDPEKMLKTIDQAKREALGALINAISQDKRWTTMQAYYALVHLEKYYLNPDIYVDFNNMPPMPTSSILDPNYVDPRTRNEDQTVPAPDEGTRGTSEDKQPEDSEDE